MKREYINRYWLRFVYMACTAALMLSCSVNEDLSECDFTAKVKVVIDDVSVKSPDCEKVTLYVFDKDDTLLEERQVKVGEIAELHYPYHGQLKVYALGNAQHGKNEHIHVAPGGKVDMSCVELIQAGTLGSLPYFTEHLFYYHPSDLFLGDGDAENTRFVKDVVTEIPIHRVVSSARVTIRRIKEYLQATSEDFDVLVLPKYNKVGFARTPSGGTIAMAPAGSFVDADEYLVPPFNFLSSVDGEQVEVRVYHEGQHVHTVTHDRGGNPLTAYNGKLLDILIDFGAHISVSVTVNDWGAVNAWKDFE